MDVVLKFEAAYNMITEYGWDFEYIIEIPYNLPSMGHLGLGLNE